MKYFMVFLVGLAIIIGAISLNFIAQQLGIQTWYDFLDEPTSAQIIDYVWLFIVYPFCLGLIAYFGVKLFL